MRAGNLAAAMGVRGALVLRCAAFAAGVVINSFGIAFITKAALGTSPISSLPYVLSLALPLSLGGFTLIMNMLFIAAQFVLLRGVIKPVQLLQIPVNLVFSAAIDLSMSLLGWLEPSGLIARCASLLAGCVILAFGVALEVAPDVLLVPGEGIVRAIAYRTRVRFGSVKVGFDVTLMLLAAGLSLLLFRGLNGIGAGTIISALLVGRIVNLFNRRSRLISAVRGLRGSVERRDADVEIEREGAPEQVRYEQQAR